MEKFFPDRVFADRSFEDVYCPKIGAIELSCWTVNGICEWNDCSWNVDQGRLRDERIRQTPVITCRHNTARDPDLRVPRLPKAMHQIGKRSITVIPFTVIARHREI